ncbi:MAG: chromate resistance protein ChrB domain-containing protein [Rubrivivax sp.]
MWAVLITTLPSRPNAVRLRIWRALKALGCAALRDGAYVLPEARAQALEALAAEVTAHGGSASVLALAPRSEAQAQALVALFDRRDAYAAWRRTVDAVRHALPALDEAAARRRLRTVAEALATVQRTDYLPGTATTEAVAELDALRSAVDAHFTEGEPVAELDRRLSRLDARRYRGRTWVSRPRPGVDRLASAWLIARFIDPDARFLWQADPCRAPRTAVGFDHDGARFTHVGVRVTFEVLALRFGLDSNPALRHIGAIVRCLDTGGLPVPAAAGLGAVLDGLRTLHADDDRLLQAARGVFDALHAAASSA